ncbi:MAG: hypothetical protein GC155_04725 [Alphaproteobacteria bacterium]|nr:hypothetical protein [Alphaproteobacteria bacterium]
MGITPQSVNAQQRVFRAPNACRCSTRNHPLIDARTLPSAVRHLDAWVVFRCTGPHGRVLFNPRDGRPATFNRADPAYRSFYHLRRALASGEFCGCGLLLTRDCDAYPQDEFLPFGEPWSFLTLLEMRDAARATYWRRHFAKGSVH